MPAQIVTEAENAGRLKPQASGARLFLLLFVGVLWAGAVACRLGYVAIIRHQAYLALALRQQQRAIIIAPERGPITDRNDRELAVSLPVQSCFAVSAEIKNPVTAAHRLSPILNLPEGELRARLQGDRTFAWVARRLAPEVVERITALNLPGIYFHREMERFYPKGSLAAQVLGFVDIDGHGQAGIEYSLDRLIAGQPGSILVLADGHRHFYQRTERPPVPGGKVVLTIDENIQYIAEKELKTAIEKTHAIGGSVLVLNPNNGALLAMANWPIFDPNLPGDGNSAARQNRALSDIYEPGSTFKTVTISSAIDSGIVTPEDVFNCQMGHIVLAGRLIHDWHPFGLLTVGEVLMHSSDVGAIKIALKLGAQTFYHYMRAYGFGQKTGIDLPWESPGMLRPPRLWSASAIGSFAMGQAVGVTALQLARAVSAIANGGLLFQPRIVRAVYVGQKIEVPPEPVPTRVISEETAATMRHLMEGVVLEGTGRKAQLDGYTTAGKTGTAQKIDPVTHRYSHSDFIASFVGYAPINNPAVLTLVVLDSPRGGHEAGVVAAPLFKQVMQQVMAYLQVPRDLPLQPIERAHLTLPSTPSPGLTAQPPTSAEAASEAATDFPPLALSSQRHPGGTQNSERGRRASLGVRRSARFARHSRVWPTRTRNGNAP